MFSMLLTVSAEVVFDTTPLHAPVHQFLRGSSNCVSPRTPSVSSRPCTASTLYSLK